MPLKSVMRCWSKMLRQPGEDSPPRTELRRADADAGAVADFVHLIEQIEHVEPHLRSRPSPDVDLLHDAHIDLMVIRQAVAVRVIAPGAQAAAVDQVGGYPSLRRREGVRDPRPVSYT